MFKPKIYNHQILTIIFNSFICLLFRLPYFILSSPLNNKGKEKGETYPKSLFEISVWYIVLGLIIRIRTQSFANLL